MPSTIPTYESLTVEFKSEWNEKKDGERIKRTIVAFANTVGGDLYIGVNDEGEPVGLENPAVIEEKLSSSIRDNISPSLVGYVTTERLRVNEKNVLKVHVEQGALRPYTLDPKASTGVYVRFGNTSNPASIDDIAKMVRESNPVPFEDRLSVEQNLTFDYCKKFCLERGMEFDPKSNLTFGFWNSKYKAYTNLAYIFSDQSPVSTVMIEFLDDDKLQMLNSDRVTGSILMLFDKIIEFIGRSNYAWTEKPNGTNESPERIDHYYVEPRVILEAVVNMIAHRDYSKSPANLVHITPSRIDLTSVGGLVEGLSLEDIAERMSTECRNKKLATFFSALKLMESRGSGFRYIRYFYKGRSISDLLNVSLTSFTITLPRMNAKAPGVDRTTQEILNYIGTHKEVSRKDIQDFLGISQTKATGLLKKMLQSSLLEVRGGGRSTRYRIKNGG